MGENVRLYREKAPSALGMDEQVSHLSPEYVELIRELIQKQLEVIATAGKEQERKKTRR